MRFHSHPELDRNYAEKGRRHIPERNWPLGDNLPGDKLPGDNLAVGVEPLLCAEPLSL